MSFATDVSSRRIANALEAVDPDTGETVNVTEAITRMAKAFERIATVLEQIHKQS